MRLLQSPLNPGYPTEYLLSRIRGRRSRLIADWKPLLFEPDPGNYLASARYQGFVRERSAEGIWGNLIREYRWVYLQMNPDLQAIFAPFFFYSELRTLFICLRRLKEKKLGSAGDLLEQSLLCQQVKDILSKSPDTGSAIKQLEKLFVSLSPRFEGMDEIFSTEELRGVERFLTNTYLALITGQTLDPLIRAFFARLIDTRNILSLYKYFRYEQKASVPVIPGGTIPPERFLALLDKDNLPGLHALARKFSGMRLDIPDAAQVETALYKAVTRFLKTKGREPLGPALILDYLWRCSLEVMNISALFSGSDLDRETVAAEIVQ